MRRRWTVVRHYANQEPYPTVWTYWRRQTAEQVAARLAEMDRNPGCWYTVQRNPRTHPVNPNLGSQLAAWNEILDNARRNR